MYRGSARRGGFSAERAATLYRLLTAWPRGGRARPDGARGAEFGGGGVGGWLLGFPAFLAQDAEPAVASLAAERLDLLPVHFAADTPVLGVEGW
jgi:hypothetical protein